MVQTGDNHDDADGLGASIYMEGCSRGLKQIKIAGKDGDDVVIVPQSAARQSRPWADLLVEDKGHSYDTWLDVNRRAPSVPGAFGAFGCLGEVSQLFSFGFLIHQGQKMFRGDNDGDNGGHFLTGFCRVPATGFASRGSWFDSHPLH